MSSSNKNFYIHIGIPDKDTIKELIRNVTIFIDLAIPFMAWVFLAEPHKATFYCVEIYQIFLYVAIGVTAWGIALVRFYDKFKSTYFLYVAISGEFISLAFLYFNYYNFKNKLSMVIYICFIISIMCFFIIKGVPTRKSGYENYKPMGLTFYAACSSVGLAVSHFINGTGVVSFCLLMVAYAFAYANVYFYKYYLAKKTYPNEQKSCSDQRHRGNKT